MTSTKRKIYVASSWRNQHQPSVVISLRLAEHQVYDFRNPSPGEHGFAWAQIDLDWSNWSLTQYREALKSPVAQKGFKLDKGGLNWADTCVLVLPCGRSAHLEAGYMIGDGKQCFFYLPEEGFEPELMYLLGTKITLSMQELLKELET